METLQNLNQLPWEGILINLLIPGLGYILTAGLAYFIWYKWLLNKARKKKLQPAIPVNQVIQLEVIYSVRSFLIWTVFGLLIIVAILNGFTKIYLEINEFGWPYLFFSIIILIFIHDTYFYWTHRLMHHPKVYKYTHRTHHKFSNPTPWSAFAFDPLEAIIQAAYFPVLVFLIPLHWSALAIFLLYMIIMNVIGHLGYEIFSQKFRLGWIGKWSNTATNHNLHHLKSNCNYGLYFRFWDVWMGTDREPNIEEKIIE